MIRKSGYRFSEKIMLNQKDRAGWRFEEKSSRSRRAATAPSAIRTLPTSLGIRKASIHYHLPFKTDLGIAVVDRYIARFADALTAPADDRSQSSMAMLDFYVQPYLQFASTPDRACLSGALSEEMMALPLRCANGATISSGPIRCDPRPADVTNAVATLFQNEVLQEK
jgi:AcrR family transcriptional regulator